MIKFLIKSLFFFVLVVVIDVSCGYGFNILKRNAKGGDTRRNYYIAEKCCDDILILGSSRAARHYVPSVIEDSLGMSCYNCGEPGCGIITAYARYKMVAERKKPKIVIYEVYPDYDYYKTDEYSKYLGRIRQYADKPVVKKMFLELGDGLEGVRLFSNMYRNNSFIFHNVVDNLIRGDRYKGYKPLIGVLKDETKESKMVSKQSLVASYNYVDSVKLSYLEKLIVEMKRDSVTFCFMVSPRFIDLRSALMMKTEYNPIKKICHKHKVPFIDYTYLEGVSDNKTLFQDIRHLNHEGALLYTAKICSVLSGILAIRTENAKGQKKE